MKVVITAREANEMGVWDAFCTMMGLCPYCMNEGMDPDTEFTLSQEQAEKLGIIPMKD